MYTKCAIDKILEYGTLDYNPRPVYQDHYEGAKYNKDKNIVITKEGQEILIFDGDKVIEKDNEVEVQVPAHTLSVNNRIECTYDLSKGESPLITLRPIATKASIAEILWIYQKKSNDLVEFDELLGRNTWDKDHNINNWWADWAIRNSDGTFNLNEKGHPHIGSCYGESVRKYICLKIKLSMPLRIIPMVEETLHLYGNILIFKIHMA